MVNTAEFRQIFPLRENTLRHVVEGDDRYPRAMNPSAYNKNQIAWWNMFDKSINSISPHYIDVILTTMASQITNLTVVYWIVYSGADKKATKLRVTGVCAGNSPGPVNSTHKWPVTRKMFPFDEVVMKYAANTKYR